MRMCRLHKMQMGLVFMYALTGLWGSAVGQVRANTAKSGTYDNILHVVVHPDGSLDGYFYEERMAGQFSCGFLLHSDNGPDAKQLYHVVTWWPYAALHEMDDNEIAHGTLSFSRDAATLQLPKEAHGGCDSVDFELAQGQAMKISFSTKNINWLQPRVVKDKKVNLRNQPDLADKSKAYVVEGDVVMVTERKNSWLHVEFTTTGDKSFSGWVQDASLLPFSVPTK